MGSFTDCLMEMGLKDLGFHGYPYTWENRSRGGMYIEERLDRFLVNGAWWEMRPMARVLHLDQMRSDHRPISCDTLGDEDVDVQWGWSFRFKPHWAKHDECVEKVKEA
ncbi:unnamed protein product [Linum trigynum]|uniref:Uncharacterized protein n=1 Tax=Linum trigynum TaxID=586398 RepID=A0AAV2G8B9_9ROSI